MTSLHLLTASVGSGSNFQAEVSLDSETGNGLVLFRGSPEIANRLAACWNAQYGVPDNLVQAPVVGYIDASAR